MSDQPLLPALEPAPEPRIDVPPTPALVPGQDQPLLPALEPATPPTIPRIDVPPTPGLVDG